MHLLPTLIPKGSVEFKDEQDAPTGQSRGLGLYIFDARHHFSSVYSTPFLMHRKIGEAPKRCGI